MHRRLLLLLPLLSLVPLGWMPAQAPASSPATKIDAVLRRLHEHGMFNGVLRVTHEDTVTYRGAYGLADPRSGAKLGTETPFYVASVSKQFTAAAVMMLVDDGKLTTGDPLVRYVPELKGFCGGVTIHHLLTHASGIPDYLNDLKKGHKGLRNSDVIQILEKHGSLLFRPGEKFSYSNSGYVLLSVIIERVTKRPFREFVKKRIFDRLGMAHSAVCDVAGSRPEGRAVGFDLCGAPDDYELLTSGAGGIYTTVDDLARWNAALIAGKLWKPATRERIFTRHAPSRNYGYGWMIAGSPNGKVVFHAGGFGGFRCVNIVDLGRGIGITALSNCGSAAPPTMIDAVRDVLSGQEPRTIRIKIGPWLAKSIREQGLEAAMKGYDRILAAERSSYDLGEEELNTLGYAYLRTGDADTAVAVFRKNASTFPKSYNVHDSLGEALMKKGLRDEAVVSYARSLVLNPRNANAIEMLQRLKTMP